MVRQSHERKAREEEERKKAVAVKLQTITQHEARIIGCENLCNSTMRMLDIRKYLTSRGWKRDQINFALMQIIARAIYPYSELKTVRYLRENTALAEMFGIEEKILLFDITNSYFEGKMENSELCQYGRSKEKRDDCKIVVLATVVNTEELLVRTMIYEGNRHDSTTVEEVVGTLAKTTTQDAKRIVVMDAGFYSKSNVNWLKANGFDYITVLPSGDSKFESTSSEIIDHTDNRDSRYACRWVRLTWMENPSRHSWWIVTQRVPRNAPCMSRHANVTRRDWKQSKVSVTKYRLKLKKHENVRWDEIMRIASTQVVVTAKVETIDGQVISIRQSTEAESKLSAIYDLLCINPKPLGKRRTMLHPNQTSKNPDIGNQGVT